MLEEGGAEAPLCRFCMDECRPTDLVTPCKVRQRRIWGKRPLCATGARLAALLEGPGRGLWAPGAAPSASAPLPLGRPPLLS